MSAIIRTCRCLVSPLNAWKNCLTPLWRIRGLETENFINTIVSLYQQVPERFLEVAQITLREFFNAIIAGKDVDPSWKKAIYKVICKLDSEVPEIFRSPNCLQELLHEWRSGSECTKVTFFCRLPPTPLLRSPSGLCVRVWLHPCVRDIHMHINSVMYFIYIPPF